MSSKYGTRWMYVLYARESAYPGNVLLQALVWYHESQKGMHCLIELEYDAVESNGMLSHVSDYTVKSDFDNEHHV